MKAKPLFFLSILMIALLGSSSFARTSFVPNSDGDGHIIIILNPDDPIGAPRSPAFNPFTAYLNGDVVVLNCSASYGNVAVTLVSTAGDNYTTVFDTEDVSIIIPVSGLSGHYTLLLTTASGSQFIGEFDI